MFTSRRIMFRLWRLTHAVAAGSGRSIGTARTILTASVFSLVVCPVAIGAPGPALETALGGGGLPTSATASARAACNRNRDFYARLQGLRVQRGGCPWNVGADTCCADDDGVCPGSCDPQDDNDCLVLASLLRTHEFLAAGKSEQGFTPDARAPMFEVRSEYYRLVPCMQALGYLNLYRGTGRQAFLKEATDRLDFLAANLSGARSGLSYDGQLGWAFLQAYQLTCREQYLEIGLALARASNPYERRVLNWGVLAALNLLEAYRITGDVSFLAQARDILTETLPFQNSDGSFPHQDDAGKRNLPYTSWLAHELCRYSDVDPGGILSRSIDNAAVLLARQTTTDGSPAYEYDSLVVLSVPDPECLLCSKMEVEGCADYCSELCPSRPGMPACWCIVDPQKECPYVDTLVNVSYRDEEDKMYDVRGWTSELPSTAFVLSRTGRTEAKRRVLSFLMSLQNQDGSFPDKWGFVPNPNHPMRVFASDSHSVIRTSCVFFYLSELLGSGSPAPAGAASVGVAAGGPDEAGRDAKAASGAEGLLAGTAGLPGGREAKSPSVSVSPSPSFGRAVVSFEVASLPAEIVVVDAGGRLVRRLAVGRPGSGAVTWDGRDEAGRPAAPGIYFVVLRDGEAEVSSKLVLLRSE